MHFELYLPFPPTVNSYYSKTRNGVFISAAGRKFRAAVSDAVMTQLPDVYIDEHMLVEVVLFPPDVRGRDVDNYNKALLDALTQCKLWEDDKLIDQLFVYRGKPEKGGSVFMRITDAGPIIPNAGKPPET